MRRMSVIRLIKQLTTMASKKKFYIRCASGVNANLFDSGIGW